MGDYNTPNLDISAGITTEFINEYSTIGFTSLKISSKGTGDYCGYLIDTTEYAGKTVKLTADVKTTNSTWKLELLCYTTQWADTSAVIISSGESSPSVQMALPSETTRIFLRLRQSGGSIGDIIYTDNWRLEEV